MGWTFLPKRPGVKAVDVIRRVSGEEWWSKKVVASTATREAVFLVVRSEGDPRGVYVLEDDGTVKALVVIAIKNIPNASDGYNFGYKDMDESAGPVGCEAPASIIAAASKLKPMTPEDEAASYSPLASAHEYRARSAAVYAARGFKRGLKVGSTIKLASTAGLVDEIGDTFEVWRGRVRGRKGKMTAFRSLATGGLVSLPANYLIGAKVVS